MPPSASTTHLATSLPSPPLLRPSETFWDQIYDSRLRALQVQVLVIANGDQKSLKTAESYRDEGGGASGASRVWEPWNLSARP